MYLVIGKYSAGELGLHLPIPHIYTIIRRSVEPTHVYFFMIPYPAYNYTLVSSVQVAQPCEGWVSRSIRSICMVKYSLIVFML